MAKQNLVSSTKGPNGGFYIDAEQENMRLLDLVNAIDGDRLFKGCGLGLKHCSEIHPCPIHYEYKAIREGLTKLLSEKSLKAVAEEVASGKATLVTILT